jgi:C1A family cysteine protease
MRGLRVIGLSLTLLTFASWLSTSALAKDAVDREIEQIQKMIEEKGYHWTAGRTSVSELSEAERQNLLGFEVPEWYDDWFEGAKKIEAPPGVVFPAVFDWRDSDVVTPVKNQGGCGSCWIFGAVGALEGMAKLYGGKELDLSEQQILSCVSYGWGCNGGWMDYCYEHFLEYGSVGEACQPYYASDTYPCLEDSCEVLAKITGWTPVAHSVDAIKTALLTGPVSCAFTVYNDFHSYTGGCYEHEGDDPCNHAIVLIGWDDNMCNGEGAWIAKNSWGTNWGMDGFFYIKYGTCNIGYATALIDYVPPGPFVELESYRVEDVAGGNGNGRPEPGETADIYFAFSNIWAPLNGAIVTVWADTDGIVFVNDHCFFGDMQVHDTLDNSSSPVQFWVPLDFPSTRVNFTLQITGNGGEYSKSWTREVWIGPSHILVVDDDLGSSLESYYIDALEKLRPLYDIWDKTSRDQTYNLQDYEVVIWFTGDHRDSVFSDQDILNLMSFLDSGGRLFLTSQDVAEVLSASADPLRQQFLADYLHVGYLGNNENTFLAAQPGDHVGDTLWIWAWGVPGAENQTSKDNLLPDEEADTVLVHAGYFFARTDTVAAIKFQGDYKLVYFGFGFEGINGSGFFFHGHWLSKPETVLQIVLDWLNKPWIYAYGDANGDQMVDLGDVVYLTNYLFKAQASPNPMEAGDANGDCLLDVGDVVYLLNYLFKGGEPPLEGCS